MKQLENSYHELYDAAKKYCEMKKPLVEKGSELAKQRYDVVERILDFAQEQTAHYRKEAEKAKEPAKKSQKVMS